MSGIDRCTYKNHWADNLRVLFLKYPKGMLIAKASRDIRITVIINYNYKRRDPISAIITPFRFAQGQLAQFLHTPMISRQ